MLGEGTTEGDQKRVGDGRMAGERAARSDGPVVWVARRRRTVVGDARKRRSVEARIEGEKWSWASLGVDGVDRVDREVLGGTYSWRRCWVSAETGGWSEMPQSTVASRWRLRTGGAREEGPDLPGISDSREVGRRQRLGSAEQQWSVLRRLEEAPRSARDGSDERIGSVAVLGGTDEGIWPQRGFEQKW